MTNNKIDILISKYLSGEATESEIRELNNWVNSSPKNRSELDNARSLWEKIGKSSEDNIPSFELFWKDLEYKIDQTKAENTSRKRNRSYFLDFLDLLFGKPILAFGTAIIFLITAGILYYSFFTNNIIRISAKDNGVTTYSLPDNSIIKLDSGSSIAFYPNDFIDKRHIKLTGHAYFDVIHNGKPFKVATANSIIEVLGTSFDVNSTDNKTDIIVSSGKVSFASSINNDSRKIILVKNQMSSCIGENSPTLPVSVSSDKLIAWIHDNIVFNNTSLREVARILTETYKISVIIDNNIDKLTLTGQFEKQTIDEIIKLICETLELNYKHEKDTYYISGTKI